MLQIKINAQTPHRGIPDLDGVSSSRVYITAELPGEVFFLHYQIIKDTSTQWGKQRSKTALKSRLTYHTYYLYVSTCSGMGLRLSSLRRESVASVLAQVWAFLPHVWKGVAQDQNSQWLLLLNPESEKSFKRCRPKLKGLNKPLPFLSALRPLELGIKSSGVNKLETLKLLMQNTSSKTGGVCSKTSWKWPSRHAWSLQQGVKVVDVVVMNDLCFLASITWRWHQTLFSFKGFSEQILVKDEMEGGRK